MDRGPVEHMPFWMLHHAHMFTRLNGQFLLHSGGNDARTPQASPTCSTSCCSACLRAAAPSSPLLTPPLPCGPPSSAAACCCWPSCCPPPCPGRWRPCPCSCPCSSCSSCSWLRAPSAPTPLSPTSSTCRGAEEQRGGLQVPGQRGVSYPEEHVAFDPMAGPWQAHPPLASAPHPPALHHQSPTSQSKLFAHHPPALHQQSPTSQSNSIARPCGLAACLAPQPSEPPSHCAAPRMARCSPLPPAPVARGHVLP